ADRVGERSVADHGPPPPGLVVVTGLLDRVGELAQPRENAHRLRGGVSWADEVYHVALCTRTGCAFEHHDVPAVPRQAPCGGQAGDPRAAHDGLHDPAPSRRSSTIGISVSSSLIAVPRVFLRMDLNRFQARRCLLT